MDRVLFNKDLINYIGVFLDIESFNNLHAASKVIREKLHNKWLIYNHETIGAHDEYINEVLKLDNVNWRKLYANILRRDNLNTFIKVIKFRKDKVLSARPIIINDGFNLNRLLTILLDIVDNLAISFRVETEKEELICHEFIPRRIFAYIAVRNPEIITSETIELLMIAKQRKLITYIFKYIQPTVFLNERILSMIVINGYDDLIKIIYKFFGKIPETIKAWNSDIINRAALNGHKKLAQWLLDKKFGPHQQIKKIMNNIKH